MKKETTKILAFAILGIITISLLAGIVSAQGNEEANRQATAETGKSMGERIVDWWSTSTLKISDQSKTLLSKILLMALVILIVYSITAFLPFVPPGKDYINWLIATIIGILSFLFVSADNIRYIVTNYEALGVMLTSVLPFVVLLVFSYKLRENNPSIANIINPALFIGFLLYVGSKWLTYKPSENVIPELAYVYPLTVGLTVIWLVFERRISHYFFKKELLGDREKYERMNETMLSAESNKLTNLVTYVTDPKLIKELRDRQAQIERLLTSLRSRA